MEFNNKFKEERDVLFNVQDEEYENLALKCFNIAKRLWQHRVFTNDGDFESRKQVYEDKSNPLMAFIKENYEREINKEILFSEFYEDFSEFLESRGFRHLSSQNVSCQLKNEGFATKVLKIDGHSDTYILGLKQKVSQLRQVSPIYIQSPCDKTNTEVPNLTNLANLSNPFQSYEKPNNDIHMNIIVPEKPKEQTEKEAFFKEMEYH